MNAIPRMGIYELAAMGAGVEHLLPFYERLVPPIFPDCFPPGFQLAPSDWHLPAEIVHRQWVNVGGGLVRPIGTLDVEFLSDDIIRKVRARKLDLRAQYPCGMKCPGCFSEDDTYSDAVTFLTWREVFDVIDEARTIGLHSIKFLGPGELFQNPDLFDILDAAETRQLPISIFTKGAELGDDELASYTYGRFGIYTASALANRLRQYSCVRILLGFNSFDPRRQDLMVGSHGVTGHYQLEHGLFTRRGVARYTEKRNQALVNLIAAGFNLPEHGQGLSLIAAPVGLDQICEIPEMYVWAARRNIPLVIAPTMESGPKAVGLMNYNNKIDPAHEQLTELYVAVYLKALHDGITDLNRLRREGISAYMGTAPCNQVANGLHMRLNGLIQRCPGASGFDSTFGNVHDDSIIEIWQDSQNYIEQQTENNWCRAKTNGMPLWLQGTVISRLVERQESET
jgi:MoaA/NifB/PqqE/SkfB family radical SAM enzyme